MREHIERLASEEFGGRRPGSDGEELTLAYIESELSRAGYVSGTNDPGNFWRAPVPLVRTTPVNSRNTCWSSLRSPHGITRRSEEHTSELQSLMRISYAVFCLKKKKNTK